MASSTAKPMEQTVSEYKILAQRDLEVIEELLDDITYLKSEVKRLRVRNEKLEIKLLKRNG